MFILETMLVIIIIPFTAFISRTEFKSWLSDYPITFKDTWGTDNESL